MFFDAVRCDGKASEASLKGGFQGKEVGEKDPVADIGIKILGGATASDSSPSRDPLITAVATVLEDPCLGVAEEEASVSSVGGESGCEAASAASAVEVVPAAEVTEDMARLSPKKPESTSVVASLFHPLIALIAGPSETEEEHLKKYEDAFAILEAGCDVSGGIGEEAVQQAFTKIGEIVKLGKIRVSPEEASAWISKCADAYCKKREMRLGKDSQGEATADCEITELREEMGKERFRLATRSVSEGGGVTEASSGGGRKILSQKKSRALGEEIAETEKYQIEKKSVRAGVVRRLAGCAVDLQRNRSQEASLSMGNWMRLFFWFYQDPSFRNSATVRRICELITTGVDSTENACLARDKIIEAYRFLTEQMSGIADRRDFFTKCSVLEGLVVSAEELTDRYLGLSLEERQTAAPATAAAASCAVDFSPRKN